MTKEQIAEAGQKAVAKELTKPAEGPASHPPVAPSASKVVSTSLNDDFFSKHAGAGLEQVEAKHLIIPRITILQALSPQVQPKKPEYIKGAQIGDICDIGMSEIFEAPMAFLPCQFITQWLEWAPRESGKGLIAIHNEMPAAAFQKEDAGPWMMPDGNLIAETMQFFGLNLTAGGRESFVPMTSTQLKKGRRWLTLSKGERVRRDDGSEFEPPLFYRVYNLSTAEEGNAKGDWVGWRIERGPKLQEWSENWRELAEKAIKLSDWVKEGKAKGDLDQEDGFGQNSGTEQAM